MSDMETGEVATMSATIWTIVLYIASIIAIGTFMCHFWWPLSLTSYVLWVVSGFFAIFSIYGGIIQRSRIAAGTKRGIANAAAVIGCLILLGLTVSAVMILVPISLSPLH